MNKQTEKVVILDNGRFPESRACLDVLDSASVIICCDGAIDSLRKYGLRPTVIIGDLDSISEQSKEEFRDLIIHLGDQDSNDQTKAARYCISKGYKNVIILGATGHREDHALGNISLMLEYYPEMQTRILTDHGEFFLLKSDVPVPSEKGDKISIFSVDNRVRVSSKGLLYPLEKLQLHNWYSASLNEVSGNTFSLHFESERPLIIYRARN